MDDVDLALLVTDIDGDVEALLGASGLTVPTQPLSAAPAEAETAPPTRRAAERTLPGGRAAAAPTAPIVLDVDGFGGVPDDAWVDPDLLAWDEDALVTVTPPVVSAPGKRPAALAPVASPVAAAVPAAPAKRARAVPPPVTALLRTLAVPSEATVAVQVRGPRAFPAFLPDPSPRDSRCLADVCGSLTARGCPMLSPSLLTAST